MKRLLSALIAAILLLPAAALDGLPAIFNHVDRQAMDRWVDSVMNAMSLDERIGQLMVVDVKPDDSEWTSVHVEHLVKDLHVGGLIYSESSLGQQVAVTNLAQSCATVPLLITVDGEWGLAMRVSDVAAFKRNIVVGAIDDDRVIYSYGREVARQLRRAGIHVNFAPVLDVNDNPDNPVIGSRSFGEDPDLVARHAVAYARGLEDGGVISVGKHFPGHGATWEDSHKTLPTISKSMKELNVCELVPFRRYIDAGLSGILTAHLYVPAVDKKAGPTTMSRRCVTDLLRKQLHFGGLIFTDALGMKGATQHLKGSACVNALKAGNDVLLMPENVSSEIAAMRQAVASGQISAADIDEHCRRILCFKYALGLTTRQRVDERHIAADINNDEAAVMQRRLVAGSITVAKNVGDILPVGDVFGRSIAVVTVGLPTSPMSTIHRRADDYARTKSLAVTGSNVGDVVQELSQGHYGLTIIAVNGDEHVDTDAVKALAAASQHAVLLMLGKPYSLRPLGDLVELPHVDAAVLGYDTEALTQDYAIQTIFGGNAATGSLPVSLQCTGHLIAAGTGIHYEATRLGYTIPAEVGIDNRLLAQVDSVVRLGIREHAFPGCQVIVGRHGKIVCDVAMGETAYGNGVAVTDRTLFGLASVSKATGTLSAVMRVFDNGGFRLDDPASQYITGLQGTDKEDITFRDLLYHETGMPPSLSMWEMMMDHGTYRGALMTSQPDDTHTIKVMNGAYGHRDARLRTDILATHASDRFPIAIADGIWGGQVTYDSIMARIYHAKLGEKRYRYSCLNFCLLAQAMQIITCEPLNDYVDANVFGPLGAYHTCYRPLSRFSRAQIATTEVDTYLRRQHIHGYVHDELAAFSGGVQGNAGLFSSANDLAKLLQMWLNGGTYGGIRFLQPSTVEVFTTQKSPNSHRGLGFDKPVVGNPDASNTCEEATPATFGHTGFTGTSFWVDPTNDMFYIFLSNRVSPTRDNPNFGRISARSHIHSLIYKNIVK